MNILFFLTPKFEVACLSEDDTLRQALEKMEHHHYAAIPILTKDGKYYGTLTEGDLLWAIKNQLHLDLKEAEHIRITEIERRDRNVPVNVRATMEELVACALNQNFVPVLDDGDRFIGIIRRRELLDYLYQHAVPQKSQSAIVCPIHSS